jgi:uncharacterized protein YlxW (UPF0749 family)
MGTDEATEELTTRREDLARKLASKEADELAVYAADVKNQVENLRLLIAAVDADLSPPTNAARGLPLLQNPGEC